MQDIVYLRAEHVSKQELPLWCDVEFLGKAKKKALRERSSQGRPSCDRMLAQYDFMSSPVVEVRHPFSRQFEIFSITGLHYGVSPVVKAVALNNI